MNKFEITFIEIAEILDFTHLFELISSKYLKFL